MTESVILQHRARFCSKSLFHNCAMYPQNFESLQEFTALFTWPQSYTVATYSISENLYYPFKIADISSIKPFPLCTFNRKSMKWYKSFYCVFLSYSASLIYKRNYGKGTKIVTIFTIRFLKYCYCFRINGKLRILQLFRDYQHSDNPKFNAVQQYISQNITVWP